MVVNPGPPTFEVLLVRGALAVLAAGLVWSAVVLAAVTVEAMTQGRLRLALAIGCPARLHRWLLGVLGAALAATVLAPPAHADQGPGGLDGLPLPDRAVGGLPRAQPGRPVSEHLTVRSGQSLWAISRSRLPPDASTDQTAALTQTLYRRNRAVIGGDPDLIHPGQVLAVPTTPDETRTEDS